MRIDRGCFKYFLFSLLLTLFCPFLEETNAQQLNHFMDRLHLWGWNRELSEKDPLPHLSARPWPRSQVDLDSHIPGADTANCGSLFCRKLSREHAVDLEGEDHRIVIDPLLRFELGKDLADGSEYGDTTSLTRNIRGVRVAGDLGKKFSFATVFREEQSFFPRYLKDRVDTYGVIPGGGRVKPFEGTGFDMGMSNGYLAYAPFKDLRIEMGHGKNFFGNGYRSLFLSDNAFHYPYLKVQSEWFGDRLRYTHLFSSLQSLDRLPAGSTPENLFKRTAGSFHFAELRLAPGLFVNFFEGVIWQRWTEEGTKPLQPGIFSPLIYLNTGIQGFDGANNALTGVGFRWDPSGRFTVYGQGSLDDPGRGKWGYQLGVRAREWPFEGSLLRVEGNRIAGGTYAHRIGLQGYSHFSQPLAHPSGSGFFEAVGILGQRSERIYLRWRSIYREHAPGNGIRPIIEGAGTENDGVEGVTWINGLEGGYIVNPITNLRVALTLMDRREMEAGSKSTRYVAISLKTSISEYYYDF